ncbi:MAG: DEAD/DEAH box helicase, partial [Candidatus Thermoplasmatota archaeon]
VQVNPRCKPGPNIVDLVQQGTVDKLCESIFRLDKQDDGGVPLQLHQHQYDALTAAKKGHNYVVTTGTGSGKSLAYILPIVDHVLRNGSGKGVQAIIVYPMNALANSQLGELTKFLSDGFNGKPPVTFRRYTGQEKDEARAEVWASPPDIILTNYV